MIIFSKKLHPEKAQTSISITDSGMVTLTKEVHPSKALSAILITESGIVTLTTWRQYLKAPGEISVVPDGMWRWKKPFVRISSFLAASISFRMYMTLTSDSCNRPEASKVKLSSNKDPSNKSSAFRILRSMGSSQGCFASSIVFNSSTVRMVEISTGITPPRFFTASSECPTMAVAEAMILPTR